MCGSSVRSPQIDAKAVVLGDAQKVPAMVRFDLRRVPADEEHRGAGSR